MCTDMSYVDDCKSHVQQINLGLFVIVSLYRPLGTRSQATMKLRKRGQWVKRRIKSLKRIKRRTRKERKKRKMVHRDHRLGSKLNGTFSSSTFIIYYIKKNYSDRRQLPCGQIPLAFILHLRNVLKSLFMFCSRWKCGTGAKSHACTCVLATQGLVNGKEMLENLSSKSTSYLDFFNNVLITCSFQ